MKKLIASLIVFVSVFSLSFADNFLSHRYFEVKVDVPISISNNTMLISNFLQEQVVIDLAQIADSVPKDGFNFSTKVDPSVAVKLEFKRGPKIGIFTGIDCYGNMGISKSLFEFIGHGNELNETLKFDAHAYVDMFAYTSVQLGWNTKKYKFCVTPTAFMSMIHASANNLNATVQNTADGKFILNTSGVFDVYSPVMISNETDWQVMANELIANLSSSVGFDVEADFSYSLFNFLDVGGVIRIPIVPSTLDQKIPYNFSYEFQTDINSLMNDENSEPSGDHSFGEAVKTEYSINRPMKIKATALAKPFGDFCKFYGQFGIAIRNPGAQNKDDVFSYAEYMLGCRLSLANLLSLYLSTEYTDEIYMQKASLSFNMRLFELVTGIATSSSSFTKTFQGTGLGAFVTVYMGF
jgi:hypothetical protein